jgi:CheY-like chemotaxis protein
VSLTKLEDNPIAQSLLVKQLQRYNLDVIATSNGEEAIHGVQLVFVAVRHCLIFLYSQNGRATNPVSSASPSSTIVCPYHHEEYAMFDLFVTDMPVCDGVEAAKRLRHLENKREASTILP